ncbi:MAG: hypothetical protein U0930_22010 [Pirellulales bacterium]
MEQPKLDAVLADLGVTARLAQNSQRKLYWKSIAKPRALVQLFTGDKKPIETSQVSFIWLNNQALQIEFTIEQDSIVLIRQFNDGQWKLEGSDLQDAQTSNKPLAIQPNELFVSASVSSGRHKLVLSR